MSIRPPAPERAGDCLGSPWAQTFLGKCVHGRRGPRWAAGCSGGCGPWRPATNGCPEKSWLWHGPSRCSHVGKESEATVHNWPDQGLQLRGDSAPPPSLKLLGVSGGKPQVRCSTHPIACTGGQEEDQGGGCPGGLAIWDTPLDRTEENGRTGVDAACRAGTPGAAGSQKEEGTAQEALERPPRGPF